MRRLALVFTSLQSPRPQMESNRFGNRWKWKITDDMAGSVSSSKEVVCRITRLWVQVPLGGFLPLSTLESISFQAIGSQTYGQRAHLVRRKTLASKGNGDADLLWMKYQGADFRYWLASKRVIVSQLVIPAREHCFGHINISTGTACWENSLWDDWYL